MRVQSGLRRFAKPTSAVRVHRSASRRQLSAYASGEAPEPLLVRTARGEVCERPPAWMMRQAGRYQKAFRDLAVKYPSFRQRSENTDLVVEITLQPWESFKPDGVILFSDILTPLPALGIDMEIDNKKGPIIENCLRSKDQLSTYSRLDIDKVNFVGESLKILRSEVGSGAAVLGFVGSPWTLATYVVEGGSTNTYTTIKSMIHTNPELLKSLLTFLADEIGQYAVYQIKAGAQALQIFDSWGGQLPPRLWDQWSRPYIERIVQICKKECPDTPLTLYANGSGGILERMRATGVDTIGLDWTVDMGDARARLGSDVSVQGNVDPAVLFASPEAISEAIIDCRKKAGDRGHILNLGHGVLVGTPEESVAHFFETNRSLTYER